MGEEDKGRTNKGEREFETGTDESWKANMKELFDIWMANIKRTYDEMQAISLEGWKSLQKYQEKVLSDAQQSDNERQKLANLSLANAIENANALSKQMIAHNELARDRQWNVNETDAYSTILASKIAKELNKAKQV
jgi:hypothetical protein